MDGCPLVSVAPVCYTKPLDSFKSWNDHFFWVDDFACPASFPWHTAKHVTRDPAPVAVDFNAQDYATLVGATTDILPTGTRLHEALCALLATATQQHAKHVSMSSRTSLVEHCAPNFVLSGVGPTIPTRRYRAAILSDPQDIVITLYLSSTDAFALDSFTGACWCQSCPKKHYLSASSIDHLCERYSSDHTAIPTLSIAFWIERQRLSD
ncbi:hypothetical protein Tco_1000031 [Tanacetum coccineum]